MRKHTLTFIVVSIIIAVVFMALGILLHGTTSNFFKFDFTPSSYGILPVH